MNRTYEDMSKKELITLVKRLAKQHDEWSAEAKRLQPMADELIAIWEILEGDYPQVDRVIVKELIERKIGDYEVIE